VAKNTDSENAVAREDAWIIQGEAGKETDLHLRDQLSVDADLIYDRLETGAHLHCCQSKGMDAGVTKSLADEAARRSEDIKDKIMEWQSNGQLHNECMCKRASESPS